MNHSFNFRQFKSEPQILLHFELEWAFYKKILLISVFACTPFSNILQASEGYWISLVPSIIANEIAIVDTLVTCHNVNTPDKDGYRALHYAASNNKPEIVTLLIEKYKANVNVQTHTQSTPLHQACENGCISVVNILLKHKADVSMTTIRNSTAMHCAAAAWSKPILEALSHHIAELSRRTGKTLASYVEHINLFGQTPLDVARSYYRSVPLTREQMVAQADTIAFLTSISAHERDDIHRPYK